MADLTASECQHRWPVFAPAAVLAGVRAVFALPLRIGGIRVGVLDLYRARAGDLGAEQLADALVLADTASAVLLDDAARRAGWTGTISGSRGPACSTPRCIRHPT
ncbi:hypothetical protein ACIBJE_22805 [Micromonospora sp. NPDC050187]|uniref:hypothetical protein n=1 Tax=Micromonospora sp. NPDC050187 TaxID=3364277 RepID=UPI00379DD225